MKAWMVGQIDFTQLWLLHWLELLWSNGVWNFCDISNLWEFSGNRINCVAVSVQLNGYGLVQRKTDFPLCRICYMVGEGFRWKLTSIAEFVWDTVAAKLLSWRQSPMLRACILAKISDRYHAVIAGLSEQEIRSNMLLSPHRQTCLFQGNIKKFVLHSKKYQNRPKPVSRHDEGNYANWCPVPFF